MGGRCQEDPSAKESKVVWFCGNECGGEIRNIHLNTVSYDVQDCSSESVPSHAGIFITVNGEDLIGGKRVTMAEPDIEQDFLLLAIQRELVDIAQKGLYVV